MLTRGVSGAADGVKGASSAGGSTLVAAPRLETLDLLRGVVMVLMALDHVRDFFHTAAHAPTDLAHATPALYLTRWVTHFCAPVFVLLAGASAHLTTTRGKSPTEVRRFLLVRGLWLVLLELTVVRFAWYFNLDYSTIEVQVIWALGISMIALAGLAHLPRAAIAAVGALLVGAHNLTDGLRAPPALTWLWSLLHTGLGFHLTAGVTISPLYPVLPWIGVIALGYALGPHLLAPPDRRRRLLLGLGGALTLAFVLLRAANVYGDPGPWSAQRSTLFTIFSFVNCEKYPPSLLYLLMTLGPALAFAGWRDGTRPGRLARALVVFGRVPLFFYLVHLPLVHLLAVALAWARVGDAGILFTNDWYPLPQRYGHGLLVTYCVWAAVVALLYPICRWFGQVKRRSRRWWLTYL
jgi:uncharacterized membrane protein